MTELLYQTDSYLQELGANVLSVLMDERAAILDERPFIPVETANPVTLAG